MTPFGNGWISLICISINSSRLMWENVVTNHKLKKLCCALVPCRLAVHAEAAWGSTAWSQVMQTDELSHIHPCRDVAQWGQPFPNCLHPTSVPYFLWTNEVWVSKSTNPGPCPSCAVASHVSVIRYQELKFMQPVWALSTRERRARVAQHITGLVSVA